MIKGGVYKENVENAARRHFLAAQVLYDDAGPGHRPGCRAVAGYLFGIAGELAVKRMMQNSGMKPLPEVDRRDDPFFAHFPTLRTLLGTASGRRQGELRKLSENSRLFPALGHCDALRTDSRHQFGLGRCVERLCPGAD